MKQKYLRPELEVTVLMSEDILTESQNEVNLDGKDMFGTEEE